MEKYGHFSEDKKSFIITERDIPRNWYNYLFNKDYNTAVSHVGVGESVAQGERGLRAYPVTDRAVYIIDGKTFWQATGIPDGITEYDSYECVHNLGNTEITVTKNGIRTKLTFLVPQKGQFELWKLNVTNTSDEEKRIKAIAYAKNELDGPYKCQGYNTSQSDYSESSDSVKIRFEAALRKLGTIERYYGYMTSTRVDAYDTRHTAFIGTYGSKLLPKAVLSGGCTNSACFAEKALLAVESDFVLAPGESDCVIFNVGVAENDDEINANKCRFDCEEKFDAEKKAVSDYIEENTCGVSIKTPLEKLDGLFNFLKFETLMGAYWARVRSNGFRDMTSDSDCLLTFNPKVGLERLMHILSYQYPSGYAPRRYMNGQIQDSNFSDNAVWITFAVLTAVKEYGDISVLDREVKFNDGSSGTLYEHCKRAVDYLYHFQGERGLIKIWGGDWNDTLERAGLRGKGESVWLTIAWYRAAMEFIQLANMKKNEDDARWASELAEDMKEKVDKYGWDGEYYITAIDDDGNPIGSHTNDEAKIFALPNLWAYWSGISKDGKALRAYAAMEKELETKLGLRVSYPPFTYFHNNIGGMSCKAPGVHENGGVYLHVSAWKLATDSLLKRPASVQKVLYSMLPFTNSEVGDKAEPYMMFNSYFPEDCKYRYGTPGQSWRTASGPWLLKSLISYVFGLKCELAGLRLAPCLPPDWENCSISKDFRGAHYDIEYIGGGCEIEKIEVDGEEIEGNLLPYECGKNYKVKAYIK